jgi:hypothetical protein
MNGFTLTIRVSRSLTRDYLGRLSGSSHRSFEIKAHCDYYDYHDIERDFEVAVNRGQIYNTDQQRSQENVIGDTNISQSKRRNF